MRHTLIKMHNVDTNHATIIRSYISSALWALSVVRIWVQLYAAPWDRGCLDQWDLSDNKSFCRSCITWHGKVLIYFKTNHLIQAVRVERDFVRGNIRLNDFPSHCLRYTFGTELQGKAVPILMKINTGLGNLPLIQELFIYEATVTYIRVLLFR